MKRFEGGIKYYTYATARINFPEDQVCCIACPLLQQIYSTKRMICGLTGEYIPDPEFIIGGQCKLKFEQEE